jgi:phytanoyl-CoA dioxygenase PhyH
LNRTEPDELGRLFGTLVMDQTTPLAGGLAPAQIEQFITDGFVCIDDAFPRTLADEARAILWGATGCSPNDPATWTQPVIRLGMFTHASFVEAANTTRLHAAFDQLVGPERWLPPAAMGTFPVRFPSVVDPGDTGWHIDVSFGSDTPDFMSWRANIHSKGRALLMLFLFSDVGERDAPTLIRVGSHADIARQLAPAGEQGLTLGELAADGFATSAHRPVVTATGDAGTVYLCHPFLVHAAQPHQGEHPRFLAQPPLLPLDPDNRWRGELSPVEQAVARALGGQP